MSDDTHPLRLPPSIRTAATRLAQEDGVTLDHWIAMAVAQKVGAVEAAADFFRRRANGARPEHLRAALAAVPDAPPLPGDELPPDD